MKAVIITIGDEILIGQIVNTNSKWIAEQLTRIGISVVEIITVADERESILNALRRAEDDSELVIITGGLGPTKDDITKKTIAEYFNDDTFITYPEVIEHIKGLFEKINHPFNKPQIHQAKLPSKATLLKNSFGTAPGMWFDQNKTVFVSLPGVPYEMKGLMKNEVLPRVRRRFKLPFIVYKTLITYGLGESVIAERIKSFEDNLPYFVKLAYLPSFGKVRLRLSAKGTDKSVLEKVMDSKISELQELLPDIITGFDENGNIENRVGDLLRERHKTLSTAESLTGGKIAATLVSVAGASNYFKGSFITYTADVKINLLGVSKQTIDTYTVVSGQVAEQMALSAREKLQTDYSIAVTGNAGPTTDKNTKDVGLVYIALASEFKVEVKKFNFGEPREKVINRTVNKALEMLEKQLLTSI